MFKPTNHKTFVSSFQYLAQHLSVPGPDRTGGKENPYCGTVLYLTKQGSRTRLHQFLFRQNNSAKTNNIQDAWLERREK